MLIREPEWRAEDVALLVASTQRDREYGPHGFLLSEATDPANEFAFEGPEKPVVDFAQKAVEDAQDAYYRKYDQPDNPVNRHGHIWRAKKRRSK